MNIKAEHLWYSYNCITFIINNLEFGLKLFKGKNLTILSPAVIYDIWGNINMGQIFLSFCFFLPSQYCQTPPTLFMSDSNS
jgi:hypothetical protein